MNDNHLINELTFSYVYDCLHSVKEDNGFLGFTLSPAAANRHKNEPNDLLDLQNFFDVKTLNLIIVFVVYQQVDPVIKWTDKFEMENYLKSFGATDLSF